jgi:hypothetical protein
MLRHLATVRRGVSNAFTKFTRPHRVESIPPALIKRGVQVVGCQNEVIVALEIRIRLTIENESPGVLDFIQVEACVTVRCAPKHVENRRSLT